MKITHTDIVDFEVAFELLSGLLGLLKGKNNKKYDEVKKIYSGLNIDDIENTRNILNTFSPIMQKIKNNEIKVEDL